MAKSKHGLKGKPSNNPAGKPSKGANKIQVGIYIDNDALIKLGGKAAVRKHFTSLIEKLLIK